MLIRFLCICLVLLPALSQAKQLSHTYKINHTQLKVLKKYDSYSKQGKIKVKTCSSCQEKVFTLTEKTILAKNGIATPLEDFLKVTLGQSATHILIQVNKFDQSVFYIEWGYPEGEMEGLE